jgi:hypothetical protein
MDFLNLTHKLRLIPITIIVLLMSISTASAQDTLTFATPVNGSLNAGESQSWTFNARDGEVLSFIVQAANESLDPILTISSSDGTTLISNDDYDYPASKNALIEAITLPRTGNYTAVVSAFGTTSGDYTLTMLPGYAEVAGSENFNGDNSWQTADDSTLDTTTIDGQLALTLAGIGSEGIASNADLSASQDYFAQIRVTNVTSIGGWRVGLTVRQRASDNYYYAMVNSDGLWRFMLRTSEGETVLRDWTSHPALVAGETAFTLGVLVNGTTFEFYYNGLYVGQVIDTAISAAGQMGVIIGTDEALDAEVNAQFDDLLMTTPLETSIGSVFPQQLIGGSGQATVQELQRRRLIPSQGDMALMVGESFGQAARPGVNRFPLGRGLTFTNFAYAATVDILPASAGMTGCGLVFRDINDTDYTIAYIDQTGGYGLSQRVDDLFQEGIFGQSTSIGEGSHRLLVIANGDILYYYIDGLHVGTLEMPSLEGSIGNAVVNFDPIDTTCQFNDTWLWRWEN